MPKDATVEDIEEAYIEAWQLGVKAIAIYRDGCKRTQPLNTSKDNGAAAQAAAAAAATRSRSGAGCRTSAHSFTHKFAIGGHEGYITVGMYDDGSPGEIFLVMAKEGSTISGLTDAFATSISLRAAVRCAAPGARGQVQPHALRALGLHQATRDPDSPSRSSTTSSAGWRRSSSRPRAVQCCLNVPEPVAAIADEVVTQATLPLAGPAKPTTCRASFVVMQTRKTHRACSTCGSIMVRSGACYKCANRGTTSAR